MKQVKLEIYTPESCLHKLIIKLSEIGAGCIGKYTHVSSFSKVSGTWMPEVGSQPYNGNINELCHGEEYKLEMRCPIIKVPEAIAVIRKVHPYEEPAINIIPLLNEEFNIN